MKLDLHCSLIRYRMIRVIKKFALISVRRTFLSICFGSDSYDASLYLKEMYSGTGSHARGR